MLELQTSVTSTATKETLMPFLIAMIRELGDIAILQMEHGELHSTDSTRRVTLAQQRKAFVNPQSECRIKCLNGGFCAYLVDNPTVHTCLCLLNVYYGDRCQYAGKIYHEQAIKSDKTSLDYTEVHRMKESKQITSEEEMNTDENDYTEGWDTTTTSEDDEYLYDDRSTDATDSAIRRESIDPRWLQESDDYHMITRQGHPHPQRIYLNKNKVDQTVAHLGSDDQMMRNKEAMAQWKTESDNFGSEESVAESESTDDGWMISKRRRVITNDANVVVVGPLQLAKFLVFLVVPLLRLH
uniref:EGF-like domain-containing protein n=1 Tax=Setaria digitata TaxID=48799 RepID=A0A915Q1T7_9BILA